MDSLGTWRTFFRVKEGLILISSIPAIVIKELLVVAIFRLLEQGEYERNNWEKRVIWFVFLESIIHESIRNVLKAFKACELGFYLIVAVSMYLKRMVPQGYLKSTATFQSPPY